MQWVKMYIQYVHGTLYSTEPASSPHNEYIIGCDLFL